MTDGVLVFAVDESGATSLMRFVPSDDDAAILVAESMRHLMPLRMRVFAIRAQEVVA